MDVELDLARIFESPTVEGIAAELDAARANRGRHGSTAGAGAAAAAAAAAAGGAASAAKSPGDAAAQGSSQGAAGAAAHDLVEGGYSIADDCALDASIKPALPLPSDPAPWPSDPAHVLLTGGTGFVGAFLLHELLLRTRARVHCLVRAKDVRDGMAKLRQNLEKYELWDHLPDHGEHDTRLAVVVGDLAEPMFGMRSEQFAALAAKCDAIVHCGAYVHSVFPYSRLRAANVLGTAEVLRLACLHRPFPAAVHHVSTLSVLPMRAGVVQEDDPLPMQDFALLHEGYAKTKWVAEKLVRQAQERGVPATIFRLGRCVACVACALALDALAALTARHAYAPLACCRVVAASRATAPRAWPARRTLCAASSRAACSSRWRRSWSGRWT